MATPAVVVQSELSSKITTYSMIDSTPPAFRVTWIVWDSGFRGSGLKIGDQILAVNGKPIVRPDKLEDLQRMMPKAIGQYAEYQFWADAGAREGDPLKLAVRRRNLPGVGWQQLEITGPLRAARVYMDDKQRQTYGAEGPPQMYADDQFGSWGTWYDELVTRLTFILDGGLEQRSMNSRYELQQQLENKARIDFLLAHYPGEFANTVKADWEAACACLLGARYEVKAADLEYRREEEERVQQVAAHAKQAWDAFLKAHSAETIAPFPAIDPLHGDRAAIAGKLVVLPPIGNSNWISEAGHNWFTFGNDQDGWYFSDAESPGAMRMLLARERYRNSVAPNIAEQYALIGRILPDPRLAVINDRGVFGLQVEVVAALIGDAMFVDLTQQTPDGQSLFTGEELFHHAAGALPADSASPKEVIEATVAAIKSGDQELWKLLFAHWWVTYLDDGRSVLHPREDRVRDSDWEESRRNLLGKVYAVHVVWTGEPRVISTGKEFPGAPAIDEVDVEVEHIGLFDGEYRPYTDLHVNRLWQLQRMNGGPWRISSVQNL